MAALSPDTLMINHNMLWHQGYLFQVYHPHFALGVIQHKQKGGRNHLMRNKEWGTFLYHFLMFEAV